MDEHNVHQLWGCSPFVDLGSVSEALGADRAQAGVLKCLQICPYDARHTLATICRKARLPAIRSLELVVFEEEPAALVRHMLLLHVLLDASLTSQERVETLLELHGNALLRDKTAAYLETASRQLEQLIVDTPTPASSGGRLQRDQGGIGISPLAPILDLSLLKYAQRDALVEVLQRCRGKAPYDMVQAWDARCRKLYADRFDFRRNMIDWDYHMRLAARGTPGLDPALGSVVHFYHFRHWRLHGVAYELRDCAYTRPNLTLVTTATGRTKEYKDRLGADQGRSVAARGYWGDVVCSPYHCFGTVAEDGRLFRQANKQFAHTAVDVAEHNIKAFLHELRTGTPWQPEASGSGGGAGGGDAEAEPHRAQAARGPTGFDQLQQQQQQGQAEGQAAGQEGGLTPLLEEEAEGEEEGGEDGEEGAAAVAAGVQQLAVSSEGGAAEGSGAMGGDAAAETPAQAQQEAAAGPAADPATDPAASPAAAPAANPAADPAAASVEMQRRGAELAAQEAAADAAALATLASVRIRLALGEPQAAALCRRPGDLGAAFDCVTLGNRHVHLLGGAHGVVRAALAPRGVALVEGAKYLLQLSGEQADAFGAKVQELAGSGGLAAVEAAGVPDAYLAFRLAST